MTARALREQIARMIDPQEWLLHDQLTEAKFAEARERWTAKSLAKASEILTLPDLKADRLVEAEKALREIADLSPHNLHLAPVRIARAYFASHDLPKGDVK